MPKRSQVVEIYAPIAGLRYDAPASLLDLRSMPAGNANKMAYGVNRKEHGTSLFSTASLGSPVSAVMDAKFAAGSVLQVFTNTGVHRHSSSADTFVVDGQTFTNTYRDFWTGCMYNNAFIYSNGVAPIQYKPTFVATGTAMQSALSPTTYKAHVIAPYREHLCLYRTIENGVDHYQRVRWTKKGVLTYSAGSTDFESGTAGAIDLMDALGEIRAAVPLGVTMAIYCENCIIIQTWVGGDEIYRFIKVVDTIGTPSRRGVVSHGDVNYFFSRNSFYEYYGGDDYRDIGMPIRNQAFSEINQDALNLAFVEYDEASQEVLFHVPTGSSTVPNKVWVFHVPSRAWTSHDRALTAQGTSTRFDATRIGDLEGSIGDLDVKFGDFFLQEGSTISLYGTESGHVVKKDPTVHFITVDGVQTGQAYEYVTPDIVGVNAQGSKIKDPIDDDAVNFTAWYKRYTKFSLDCAGNGQARVHYSPDKGSTWTELAGSPFTLIPSGTSHMFDMDYTAKQMRYRVSCSETNSPIAITYAKVNMIPQGVV